MCLVYSFERFASGMQVLSFIGDKDEREELVESIKRHVKSQVNYKQFLGTFL